MGIRLEVTNGHVKTHEVVVENMQEADQLWVALTRVRPGGCVMTSTSRPKVWGAGVGQDVRGTESWRQGVCGTEWYFRAR